MKNTVRLLKWVLKACIFFTLFAFALNNQHEASLHLFFGRQWRSPMVLIVLAAFAAGLFVGVLGMAPRALETPLADGNRRRQNAGTQHYRHHGTNRLPRMDFDISWLLLSLPVAFILGWAASRFDLRQMRLENRRAPKAYFRGLNFLLNEQQDQAIDAFIEAVQNDPDTSELHFALGNLFRRRGEYERAVRVHQHLISRGDLTSADRHRAQHALALDYLRAGLLDRAEEALLKLEGTPFESEARLSLLANYERSRDWVHAAEVAKRLDNAEHGSFAGRLAHYLCEQSAAHLAAHERDAAQKLLEQAIRNAPSAPRPRIELAKLLGQRGESVQALTALEALFSQSPAALPLVAGLLAQLAIDSQQAERVRDRLKAYYTDAPGIDCLEAIIMLDAHLGASENDTRQWYVRHLENEPSLVAASRWFAGQPGHHDASRALVQQALDHATKPLTRYRCAACGFEAKQHFWQCPGCQAWDSYPARRVEEL